MHVFRGRKASWFCLGLVLFCAGCNRGESAHTAIPVPPPVVEPSETPLGLPSPRSQDGPGQLRRYYKRKYSDAEVASVKAVVADVMRDYSAADQSQAAAEILSFQHVVMAITPNHRLNLNHNAIRRHEALLKKLCEKHGVPVWPVLAITSWENSGSQNKVSWADAAGLGQMTWGAVDQAHLFAAQQGLGDVAEAHRKLARLAKVGDERMVAECNLEDVVLFFKFLWTAYGERADHAIGAYHKGQGNQDDIIRDFITRKEGSCPDPHNDRGLFLEAMARNKVTYLALWNDPRSRQMLNGLRTMDGDVTTPSNASQALGDESDIYPWKVLGSLAGYRQGGEYVAEMMQKYSQPQSEVEVRGLPAYPDRPAVEKGLRDGTLVRTHVPLQDVGDAESAHAVTPELEGYLWSLLNRWHQRLGHSNPKLPVKILLGNRTPTTRGITVVLAPGTLSDEERAALQAEIKEDYLNDRVYEQDLANQNVMLCLNPRFGHEFMATYEKVARAPVTVPVPVPTAIPSARSPFGDHEATPVPPPTPGEMPASTPAFSPPSTTPELEPGATSTPSGTEI